MSYTHAERRRAENAASKAAAQPAAHRPSADALLTGRMMPARDRPGRAIDLPGAMRAKMENAFGADLSAVRLYESEAVGRAGAQAVTQGATIAFAPGTPDLASRAGQELLGHELSHVVSQARGEVRGSGFLNDPALEARADREGAMAAAGETVYDGPVVGALTDASAAPAAGPMQAQKGAAVTTADNPVVDLTAKKKVESNDAFENGLKKAVSLSGKVGSVAGTMADPQALREEYTGKLNTARQVEVTAGKILGIDALKEGTVTGTAAAGTDKALNWMQDHIDASKKTAAYSGLTGSAVSLPLAVMDLGDKFDKVEKAKKTGSRSEVANARLNTASSGIGLLKKASSFSGTVSGMFSSNAAKAASAATKTIGKGLGYAGEGVALLRDAYGVGESTRRKHRMRESAEALSKSKKPFSENDQEALASFRQATNVAGLDQKKSVFGLISRILGLSGTVANASGAGAPVGAALEGAQKVWNAVTGEVASYEKDKLHKDTVEDKLHTAEAFSGFRREGRLNAFRVSKKAYRNAYLRSLGYTSGTTDEAYEGISASRADSLTEAAGKGKEWALKFTSSAGIDPSGISRSEEEKKAVRGAILKTLGGGEKKASDFHSSDVREYNAFAEGAKAKEEADKRGFWGNLWYQTKNYGKGAWESVKTGGKKALSAVKGVGRGINRLLTSRDPWVNAWETAKTGAIKAGMAVSRAPAAIKRGALRAGRAIRDFATNAETRKKAWETVKTGAANSAKYVWKVGRHAVTSRYNRMKNWYQEGVDQMNVHKDTYDKMGLLDKLSWSAKNLPARLMYRTDRNKQATAIRLNQSQTAAEAVALMNRFQQEQNGPPEETVYDQIAKMTEEEREKLQGPEPEETASDRIAGMSEEAREQLRGPAVSEPEETASDRIARISEEAREQLWGPAVSEPEETASDQLARMTEEAREQLRGPGAAEPAAEAPAEKPAAPGEETSLLKRLEAELAALKAPL